MVSAQDKIPAEIKPGALVDKSKKYQWEKEQWKDPESFLGYS